MPNVKVGTKDILGTTVDVKANGYGRFFIELDGTVLGSGDTLEQATNNARIELNKSRVEVALHFYTADGRKGVATKIHSKTKNVMVKIGSKSEQWSPHTNVFRADMPKMARDKYQKINQQMRELRAEQRQIEGKYQMSIGNAVKAAIKEAVGDS